MPSSAGAMPTRPTRYVVARCPSGWALTAGQDKEQSEKKLKELGGLVSKFIIRRTNDLLSKYCESCTSPSRHSRSNILFFSLRQRRLCTPPSAPSRASLFADVRPQCP